MAKSEELELWERQPGESEKAFEAFVIYRDMGLQRGVRKVGDQLHKSLTLMSRWSSAYNWPERAAAWDREQDRIVREAQQEEIKKMRKRHADLAYVMLMKAAKALKNMPDDEIKAADINRMVEVGSKLERISRGDVGEVVEERQGEAAPSAVTFYMPDNGRDKKEEE